MMALFTLIPVDKFEIRAVSSLSSFTLVPLRFYLISQYDLIKSDDWLIYLIVNVTTVSGLYVGNLLVKKLNTKIVLIALMSLLFISSISNINLNDKIANTTLLIISFGIVFICWLKYYKDWVRVFK